VEKRKIKATTIQVYSRLSRSVSIESPEAKNGRKHLDPEKRVLVTAWHKTLQKFKFYTLEIPNTLGNYCSMSYLNNFWVTTGHGSPCLSYSVP